MFCRSCQILQESFIIIRCLRTGLTAAENVKNSLS